LRVNLSDLAAKGAAPYGYLLAIAWPGERDGSARRAFAEGLRADQRAFNLALFGGDTVSTPGPLIASATLMGWVPSGRMVRRSGARIGDRVLVTGTIGDGALGLVAARGDGLGLSAEHEAFLKGRYQTPRPRLGLGEDLRRWAHAAADVSDGLVADLGHIAEASGVRIVLELDRTPLSEAGARWLAGQSSRSSALAQLATGGDDYEIVCTAPPQAVEPLRAAALAAGFTLTDIGEAQAGAGVAVRSDGLDLKLQHTGWRHGQ
jgi:thiamine-monophosphate kinase